MDARKAKELVGRAWDDSIVPTLQDYIKIPNKSPLFDPKWQENGHMERAVQLVSEWCKAQPIEGLKVQVERLKGRTPLIYMETPGADERTVLLYGHLDKQPEMTGWSEGLGPWTPVLKGDRLYGRGGADDGYAAFASLTALRALQEQKLRRSRCVILIEGCEESGSFDLPFYIDALKDRIGTPDLVVCLDSGCGNYEQMWCTTSLRGLVVGDLVVEILKEGVHSGDASGIVPSTFRIARQLLSRIEDETTGRIKVESFWVDVPAARVAQAKAVAKVLADETFSKFPWSDGARPIANDPVELVLNRTWRPALAVTGAAGFPALQDAGNVLRPKTAFKLSLRVPPHLDAMAASRELKKILEKDPPYGATVRFTGEKGSSGWDAPELAPWLAQSMSGASKAFFGKDAMYMGEGGSIPFMGMLGAKFPKAQFMITGVLGPHSNAHGPNEFLHLPTAKNLTCCVAQVVADHFENGR